MHFCLIMATLNRVTEVERFLISLDAQDYRDFELIIVDQNTDDRLLGILGRYGERFPLKHIRYFPPGTSGARNAGLQQAKGEIIGFPDDDCVYPPGLLRQLINFFQFYQADGISLRILDLDEDTDAFGFSLGKSTVIDTHNAWAVGITPSMFIRQSVATQVAFDENMGPGKRWVGGEDTDYLLRCLDIGTNHYYSHELFIRHPTPTRIYSLGKMLRREYTYGRGFGFLMGKRKLETAIVRAQLWLPFSLAFKHLFKGQFGKALTCPSMGIGRLLGYWESQRELGQ